MRILITDDDQFTGSKLDIGSYYFCEKDESGTKLQNALFHALLQVWFVSGKYSYPVGTFEDLKKIVKLKMGAGYSSYVFIEQTEKGFRKGRVKSYDDVPKNIALDESGKEMVWGELKSTTKYTKRQWIDIISNLIAEMINSGENSRKFNQILQTLEENSLNRMAG